jgi:putative ABC transport system ATP-binding protein
MSRALLVARDLAKDYPMNGETVHALRGVSLSISEGEFVAVVGPSGSGKSTLLQVIGGIDLPTAGTVEIMGTSLHSLSDRDLTRLRLTRLGFIFQRAIARALANRPALLLADEPTGELDAATGQEILALFRRLHQDGTTLVVVTHDEHLASQAGRIIYMLDGRISSESRGNPTSPLPRVPASRLC